MPCSASNSSSTVITISTDPAASSGSRLSTVRFGSTRTPAITSAAHTGSAKKNSADQFSLPTRPMSRLPAAAPSTLAMPATAAAIPSAMPFFSCGNVEPISAFATGMTPHAPTACTKRPASSTSKLPAICDNPHISDPAPNVIRHPRNTGLRPRMSASLPTTGMHAA